MEFTLKDIARIVNGKIIGNADTIIKGISGLKEAKSGDITFLANSRYQSLLNHTKASAIIIPESLTPLKEEGNYLKVKNPSLAFSQVIKLFIPYYNCLPQGIHSSAVISAKAKIGKNVSLGPYVVIEDCAEVGDDSVICAGSYIGYGVKIGKKTVIYPNVTIREGSIIGNEVIIHSGTVIGSDGFGFTQVGEEQEKIPQVGIVVIEDRVEIGANVTIDRARFEQTFIGQGTKIDNLVQIAHNVKIGKNCLIIAQAGISGSTIIGDNVIIAGQAGIVGHITIGDKAVVAAQAGVTKPVKSGQIVSGYPAKPHELAKRINAYLQRLPSLYEKVKSLEEEVKKLQKGKEDG